MHCALKDRRVLVTGASGFLGATLCERLLDGGAQVHGTSRTLRASGPSPLRWWQSELVDYLEVLQLFENVRPDIVFHLAGKVTASPEVSLVMPTFQSLVTSSLNVLLAATELRCRRIIMAGSLTEPLPDRVEATPSSPYSAAKWAVSAYTRMFHRSYGTPAVIVRPFMTYGPRQDRSKVVPYVIDSLLSKKSPLLASGTWVADWVYVDDVVEGFLKAASRPGIEGRTVDLGSGQLTSIRDVVALIVGIIDPTVEPHYGVIPDRPCEEVRVADTKTTSTILDWTARTTLDIGLQRTIEWYRGQANEEQASAITASSQK